MSPQGHFIGKFEKMDMAAMLISPGEALDAIA
jgi:hypothetical protein